MLRRATFERDGWACTGCGSRRKLECDHVVPLHAGGMNVLDNLQTLCADCHMAKTRAEKVTHPVAGQEEWTAYAHAGRYRRARL